MAKHRWPKQYGLRGVSIVDLPVLYKNIVIGWSLGDINQRQGVGKTNDIMWQMCPTQM